MSVVERIRERVAAIPEPCAIAFGATTTIGAMGLIEDIAFVDGHAVVTLCLTDTACVHFGSLQRFIGDALADMPEVARVSVVQTLDTLWTPDRMAAA